MTKDTNFSVRIDDHVYLISDSIVTGQQLITQTDKRPIDEH